MKKIILTLLSTVLVFVLISCESDISKVVISSDPTDPGLADLTFTAEFSMANANELITFSWSAADFGFQSSTTYGLQVSPNSDFSDDVATLFTTQNLTGTVKVSDINNIMLTWGAPLDEDFTFYYRVYASVTENEIVYSDIKTAAFAPFETLIDYPMIYVPGAYQGWSPGAENGRLYSYGFDSTYEGILRLIDGSNASTQFKVTINPNWDGPNYGGTLTKTGDNYAGTLDPAGDNFEVVAGVYSFTVDVNALTIALTKTDDWGVIGSAVPPYDWSVDVDMTYNGQRKMWEITADFAAGEFKFRANDGWDLNYGGTDGILSAGGANIAIAAAGNYTIRFDPVALTYTVQMN